MTQQKHIKVWHTLRRTFYIIRNSHKSVKKRKFALFQNLKRPYATNCLRKTNLHWGMGQCSEFTTWTYRGCI